MFGFKKKLDTLTADLLGKMDQALEMTSPVDRVERLMTLKEETSETLNTMESRENKKAMLTVQTSVIGMFLGGAASLTIIPPAAAPLAMALPILAGILVAIPFMISSTHADRYKNELTTNIDSKISALLEESPAVVLQSPKLMAQLKSAFSPAASTPALDKIKAAVTLTSPAIKIQPPAKKKIYLE